MHEVKPCGIDGGEVGYSLRANPSRSGDKGDGGVNCTQAVAFNNQAAGKQTRLGASEERANALVKNQTQAVAIGCDTYNGAITGDIAATLGTQSGDGISSGPSVMTAGMAVRRLTPRECERLQGFPDDYTRIPWRGKAAEECPDGPRYKALGNSMAVPVMRWIGQRIAQVEMILENVSKKSTA